MTLDVIGLLTPVIEMMAVTVLFAGLIFWMRERQHDRRYRQEQMQFERDKAQERAAQERKDREQAKAEAEYQAYVRERKTKEELIQLQAGAGSGGYIVLDLPNAQRIMFHDLLKGFEEYAQLKGYSVAFSKKTTFNDRIAFKFTLTDADVIVTNDRVRKDLREYLDRVTRGDSLDDLPQIISIAEHQLLVATLRNRISFLQHSYNLAQNAAQYYESLIERTKSHRFLPAPSVVVQTGGSYSAPTYAALNSPQALVGNENRSRATIRIGSSYAERKSQLSGESAVLLRARNEAPSLERDEIIRNMTNVKEELDTESPDPSRLSRWLEAGKNAIQTGGLGYETVEAFKQLMSMFGLA